MNNRPAYRHEEKYFINIPEAEMLRMRLLPLMKKDPHTDEKGEYTIRSLYFDDYAHSAYFEKDAGVLARKKYRIRIYNNSDKVISFERKLKNDQYIYKQSAPLTRKETDMILEGNYKFLEKSEHPLLQELYYEFTAKALRPRVMVDYDREPLIMDAGTVRITFDRHVRGSSNCDLFDPNLPMTSVVPGDKTVLEVKFTEFLPEILREILPPRSADQSAISKFVLCCDSCPLETEMFSTKADNSINKNI